MKNKKMLSVVAMICVVALLFAIPVSAQTVYGTMNSPSTISETDLPELPPDEVVEPRMSCYVCGMGFWINKCTFDLCQSEIGSHTFNFNKTCTRVCQYSTAYRQCNTCGFASPIGGTHWCLDTHGQCGKGQVSVCFIENGYMPSN